MIHPQYLVALVDFNIMQFKVWQNSQNIKDFNFEVDVYCEDIQLLYKIKERFKSGKIVNTNSGTCLKITKNLDIIIQFFRKNSPKRRYMRVYFQRWSYLYLKLVTEKNKVQTDKEFKKIERRLNAIKHVI